MELMCEDCGAVIQIPTERVPQNSTFRVTCPRCKGKINASTKKLEVAQEGEKSSISVDNLMSDGGKPGNHHDEFSSQATCSLWSDHPSALLCINQSDRRANYQSVIEGLRFRIDAPVTPDQALQYLRFNQYSLILLEDIFGEKFSNPVASYLAGLNMNIRRDMLVVLVGERVKTGDSLEAFLESVDLVLHPADIGQLAALLSRASSDHQRFYKVFNECLIDAGKKLP
jgi:phage FluMu protein Com